MVAIFLGVHAEGETLENVAKPLTAEDDDEAGGSGHEQPSHQPA